MVQDFTDTGGIGGIIASLWRKAHSVTTSSYYKSFFYKEEGCYSFDGQVIERFKGKMQNWSVLARLPPLEESREGVL